VPEDIRNVFVTAHEIEPKWHVQMQGAFQRHTDNAVSKTINLPNSATREDVATAYLSAYELGCLGITVFRDGCKGEAGQVLHTGTGGLSQPKPEAAAAIPATIRPRPSIVTGYTRQLLAPEGKVNVTLNSDSSGLFEVFINVGKAGSDIAALAEALGRLVSLTLRLPSPMSATERAREIVSHLRGIGGSRSVGLGPLQIRSLPDAVSQALSLHLGDHPALAMGAEGAPPVAVAQENGHDAYRQTNGNGTNGHGSYGGTNGGSYSGDITATAPMAGGTAVLAPLAAPVGKLTGNLCPDCGCQTLFSMEGCRKCEACGYAEC
jgi:ribonucleoside-diphosphate reductase alpha chain